MEFWRNIGSFWRFLIGVALVQGATGLTVFLAFASEQAPGWALAGPVGAIVAAMAAMWFSGVGAADRREHQARLRAQFAEEREKIRVAAERRRVTDVRDSERRVAKAQRRSGVPLRMGLMGGGIAGIGVALMATQFITLGLVALTAVGGAALGWRLRALRSDAVRGEAAPPLLDVTPDDDAPRARLTWLRGGRS